MRFLVVKINALLCFQNVIGIAVQVFSHYKTPNSIIIITVPDCGLQNSTKLLNFMNSC